MTFVRTYDVQKTNRLIIDLPERFKSKKKIRVIIEDVDENRALKINQLKRAASDPLFLSDIAEASADFENADHDLIRNLINGVSGELILTL